jgi:hypothetical protein
MIMHPLSLQHALTMPQTADGEDEGVCNHAQGWLYRQFLWPRVLPVHAQAQQLRGSFL